MFYSVSGNANSMVTCNVKPNHKNKKPLATAEVKQRWSVIGWVTKNLLSRAPRCFRRHVKPLVPAAFAVVSTHQTALDPRGELWPVLLMCNP
jgi:hypothetical protein